MSDYIQSNGLHIAKPLYNLVSQQIAPDLGLNVADIWQKFATIADELSPENRALLVQRDELQNQIDHYYRTHPGTKFQSDHYKKFLIEIGYIESEVDDFKIDINNIDDEISRIAGPQLVVPMNNARFALNAANARWGSLYDALYGTDAIQNSGELAHGTELNPNRSRRAIEWANTFLDTAIPLNNGRHSDVQTYLIENNQLRITLHNGKQVSLVDAGQYIGHEDGDVILFKNHGLHIELHKDPNNSIAKLGNAGLKDIIIESAITTICDFEDSVSAVDGDDKTFIYKNWLQLMRGNLKAHFNKAGKIITRKLAPDRHYTDVNGEPYRLSGRSLLLVRNVGHLMTTPAVIMADGNEMPEGILDAMMTGLIALYDLKNLSKYKNSANGSVYIVKPKMHGSDEVTFAVKTLARIELAFDLPENTLKIGIMDEERRTTVNLKACIKAAKKRVIFINTGFLDRTGDEIHTSMEAGPFLPKAEIKTQDWIKAYEDRNVDIGLACGFQGQAQIGKGMWAMPDEMAQMLKEKIAHPTTGANCAWVPSPTAATLHATHYHQVDVAAVQSQLSTRTHASLDDILTIPLLKNRKDLSKMQIKQELDNNAQSILGYVVRWIDQGIGCSKVPDINNIGLMEDRATLRIASQLLANWLFHGICTQEEISSAFQRMASIVDEQNKDDPNYQAMAPNYDGVAYQTALKLVFEGRDQVNGYTDLVLHKYRRLHKEQYADNQ
ncbi:MAG: malate synthase G [Gammaproteobacteria bacterium]|nr:MAG: malate synthase G [Gammaproteobacteria bacterium]